MQAVIPRYSDNAIAATIACCKYVHEQYGRFPASSGPFRTAPVYQAHRSDMEFYSRFYKEEAYTDIGNEASLQQS